MHTEEVKKKLIQLLYELCGNQGYEVDFIEFADLIDDIGMDSILFISMILEIESKFDIVVPDDMLLMENFRTVDKIINSIMMPAI